MLPFSRNERQVRLGGLRLGPLRLTHGRVYTVGPLSVRRFFQFLDACTRAGISMAQLLPEAATGLSFMRAISPLMVSEPIRPRDLLRMTSKQLLALMAAFTSVNDLAYLLDGLTKSAPQSHGDEEEFEGPSWTLAEVCHFVVRESAGCYTHREVTELPMADFLAIRDSVRKLNGGEDELPEGAEALSDSERKRLEGLAKRAGLHLVE